MNELVSVTYVISYIYCYGHPMKVFFTSVLMKAGRGQKHLSEAKKGIKELI